MSKLSQIIATIRDSLRSKKGSSSAIGDESKVLSLKIISKNSGIVIIEAQKSDTGRIVKKKASKNLEENDNESNTVDNLKLTRVQTRELVEDSKTLGELKVQTNEEFILTIHRLAFENSIEDKIIASPTKRQIATATANIEVSSPQLPAFSIFEMLQEDDMRKVFVTLAQEASYVLGTSAVADKLIGYYRQRIQNYIKNHKNAKKVLHELGFSVERVEQAMKLKANHPKAALDYLISQETRDRPVTIFFDKPSSPRTSLVTSARRDSILSATYEPTGSVKERVEGLLEIVKFYAEKDELVYQYNIDVMVQMGYDKVQAHEALRQTRNNTAAAIGHIQGDKNPSIMELRTGFAETSTIRKKIMESSTIQQSLSDPESFILFIGILDNPSQANAWDPFSDLGSLMTHIIVTYHEQKHISATNQFNESRIPISALSAPN